MTHSAFPPEGAGAEVAQLPTYITRPLKVGGLVIFAALIAFLLWAAFAPLATSIPTTGHLNTSQPSYDVQHGFGGKIAHVHVAEHATVAKGALLISLDVEQEEAERTALQAALTLLMEERAALRAALGGSLPDFHSVPEISTTAQMAVRRMRNMQEALHQRTSMSFQLDAALKERSTYLKESIAHREQQRTSMKMRRTRYARLQAQGAFRAADIDALTEDILELESALQRDRAEVAALRNQADQALMQVTRDQLEYRQRLLDRLAQLEETMPRLQRQILRLAAQIDQAEIRAPAAGVVATLNYDTTAMVIPRGETVLTLARPTERHKVSFLASAQVIDQLRVGMTGQLTLAALPQRSHPRVTATITSMSPTARRDADGRVLGYDGVAEIDPEDHTALLAQLGEGISLTADMPVTVVFTGRDTTFGAYIMGPFWSFLQKAMQD